MNFAWDQKLHFTFLPKAGRIRVHCLITKGSLMVFQVSLLFCQAKIWLSGGGGVRIPPGLNLPVIASTDRPEIPCPNISLVPVL